MPKMIAAVWIRAEPERVFDLCRKPPLPLLPPDGPELFLPPEPGVVGSRYRWEFRRVGLHGRFEGILTESLPPRRLAWQSREGWSLDAEVELTPERDGTRLRFRLQYRFPVPYRWVIPSSLVRIAIWRGLHEVKRVAEREAPTTGALNSNHSVYSPL